MADEHSNSARWSEPADVIRSLANHVERAEPVAILTGAGVSLESGIPTAAGVVRDLQRREMISQEVTQYQAAMATAFASPAQRGAYIRGLCHGRSAGLANQLIAWFAQARGVGPLLTTNFDHLLEQACVASGDRPVVVSLIGSPAGPGAGDGAIRILKLHGDAQFDMTAHSDVEMATHHLWLDRWAQFGIRRESSLLVLGHSGADKPIRDLVVRLLGQGVLSKVSWAVYEGESAATIAGLEKLQQQIGEEALELFRSPGADQTLSQLFRECTASEPEVRRLLLPGFQVVTGLVNGSGEIDPAILLAEADPSDVAEMRRRLPPNARSIQVNARHRPERTFRAAAALAQGNGPIFVFSLDQADNLPGSQAFARSFTGWVARVSGRVFEPSCAHLAAEALGGLSVRLVVNISQGFATASVGRAVARIVAHLHEDARVWVIADEGEEPLTGFETYNLAERVLTLPASTAGILPFLRHTLDESDFATILEEEARGRTLEELIALGLAFRRGRQVVLDRTRWPDDVTSPTTHLNSAIAALGRIRGSTDSLARLTLSSDLEALHYAAADASNAPHERQRHLDQAIEEAVAMASSWSGVQGIASILVTLGELAAAAPMLDGLDGFTAGQLARLIDRWPPAPEYSWLGQTGVFAGFPRALSALAREIDTRVLGLGSLSYGSTDEDIRTHMENVEATWPGAAFQVAGWLGSADERLTPTGMDRYFDLLKLAEAVSTPASWRSRAVTLDDAALLLSAADEPDLALELWSKISRDIVEVGGIAAAIHCSNYGWASYVAGDLERASALIFESVLLSARNGDEARVWRPLVQLSMSSADSPILGWARDWVRRADGRLEGEKLDSALLAIASERGLRLFESPREGKP